MNITDNTIPMEVLKDQERLQQVIEKLMLHVLYTNYEIMTARQMKIFVDGCIEVGNNIGNCSSISMVLTWIMLLIETNDSYVEHWDGATEDLPFVYDLLCVRSHLK